MYLCHPKCPVKSVFQLIALGFVKELWGHILQAWGLIIRILNMEHTSHWLIAPAICIALSYKSLSNVSGTVIVLQMENSVTTVTAITVSTTWNMRMREAELSKLVLTEILKLFTQRLVKVGSFGNFQ